MTTKDFIGVPVSGGPAEGEFGKIDLNLHTLSEGVF